MSKSASKIDEVTRSITLQSGAVQSAIEAGVRSIETCSKLARDVEGVLTNSHDAVECSAQGVTTIASSVAEQRIASTKIA